LSDVAVVDRPAAAAPAADVAPARYVGLVRDLSNEEYQDSEGLSSTQLRNFARSPWHFFKRHRDPKRPPQIERAGQLGGSLMHCAALEPNAFDVRYPTLPPDAPARPTERQLKAAKKSYSTLDAIDFWRGIEAANPGALAFITPAQYETAMRQAESVRALPQAAELFALPGYPEVSAYAADPETGVYMRCRPDYASRAGQTGAILLDLKSYDDASPRGFKIQIERKRYDLQDAHYCPTFELASSLEVLAFVLIAVETEWPYAACAHVIDDDSREEAAEERARLLRSFAQCEREQRWPSYSDDICQVTLRRRLRR
jgi:hypothetical protein